MRIAIYSRKSKFTGKGESIENQITLCQVYIRTHIADADAAQILLFEDEGFSGKNLSRPQFIKMMEEAQKEPFDYIVCYRLDRISRSVSDFSALIEKLNTQKTAFICIKEQFDTSNPMGKAMMYIASVFAQLERETIAERIRDNMFLLAKTGRWLGGITPFGFRSEKEETCSNGGKPHSSYQLTPIETEYPLIQLIYRKFLEMKSLSGVSRYLNQHGILTRQNNPFTLLAVRELLTNPVYCTADQDAYQYFTEKQCCVCFEQSDCSNQHGIMPYNRTSHLCAFQGKTHPAEWIISIGSHPGAISGKLWRQTQHTIEAQGNHSNLGKRKTLSSPALLSGLLRCSHCGHCMRPHLSGRYSADGKPVFYYICEWKEKSARSGCGMKNAPGSSLDETVCRELFRLCIDRQRILQALQTLRARCSRAAQPSRNASSLVEEKQRQIQKLLLVLSSDQNDSDSSSQIIRKQINLLQQQCEALEAEFAPASVPDTGWAEEWAARLGQIPCTLSNASTVSKKEFLRSMIDSILWDGSELHLYLSGSQTDPDVVTSCSA